MKKEKTLQALHFELLRACYMSTAKLCFLEKELKKEQEFIYYFIKENEKFLKKHSNCINKKFKESVKKI